MTPTTREIVERLAKECIAEDWTDHAPGYYRSMNLERFWQAAMEHAAGICDEQDRNDLTGYGIAEFCAAAIRQAAK